MSPLNSQPLYQKIRDDIRNRIENHELLPGDRLPTEQQFMEKYNVSRITVSKALNELKEKGMITRFPNRGTFVAGENTSPSLISEAPVPEVPENAPLQMTEIACILPTITDSFSLSMVNGVLSVFPEDTYICHIFQSRNPTAENYLLQRCIELNISGIVLFPQDQPFFSNQLLFLQLQKYPLVLLDRYLPRLDTSYVIADNHRAGSMCLRHLYELKHQKIGFITATAKDTFTVKYRIAGILDTAESLNMPESAVKIVENLDKKKKFSHYQELFYKLIKEERITAFITAESSTCVYLYELLSSMGMKVPDDISLLSFDKPSNSKTPDFFTHISQSEYLMGHEAGSILKNRIEQHDMTVYHRVIAPTMEIGESTGPLLL